MLFSEVCRDKKAQNFLRVFLELHIALSVRKLNKQSDAVCQDWGGWLTLYNIFETLESLKHQLMIEEVRSFWKWEFYLPLLLPFAPAFSSCSPNCTPQLNTELGKTKRKQILSIFLPACQKFARFSPWWVTSSIILTPHIPSSSQQPHPLALSSFIVLCASAPPSPPRPTTPRKSCHLSCSNLEKASWKVHPNPLYIEIALSPLCELKSMGCVSGLRLHSYEMHPSTFLLIIETR